MPVFKRLCAVDPPIYYKRLTRCDSHKYHDRLGSTLDEVVYLLRTSLQLEPGFDIRLAEEAIKCFQVIV